MKSIKSLCFEFKALIGDANISRIEATSREHASEIPFIQLPILYDAFDAFIKTGDPSCVRTLAANGFQPFITSSDYGTGDHGLDPPILELFVAVSGDNPNLVAMSLLSELYELYFDQYLSKHFDPNCNFSTDWNETLVEFRDLVANFYDANTNKNGKSQRDLRLDTPVEPRL